MINLPEIIMKKGYHISLTVNNTPQEVFNRINNVTKWWTENLEGNSQNLDDEFTVRFGDVHVSTQRLVEVVPDKKIVWLVNDSNLNFIEDKHEWTNTKVIFEISVHASNTQIDFYHIGLVPDVECYEMCVKGWDHYIKQSLFNFLTHGKGMPEIM